MSLTELLLGKKRTSPAVPPASTGYSHELPVEEPRPTEEGDKESYEKINGEMAASAEDNNKRCYSKLKPGDSFVWNGVECFVDEVFEQESGFIADRWDEIRMGHQGYVKVTYVDRNGVIRKHEFTAPILIPVLEKGPIRS